MARVNVFLSDRLLDESNQQAKEEGINRSALIQAAKVRRIPSFPSRLQPFRSPVYLLV